MLKLIPSDSYDFGIPAMRLLKLARYRMGGNDRKDLLKFASESFIDEICRLDRHPGEELAHNIALGTTESIGINRNGDGFKAAWCRKNHPTFVKLARAYRNHQNKHPEKSYGVIKLSHFNEPMQRIELCIAYNGTKEAADRNRGLVADLEIDKLAADKPFASSMACLVSHDVCTGCNHKARTRDDYCDGPMCKYGGLKHNIGRTFSDGHTLGADNPNPRWFDLSHIVDGRGADRTSFTLGRIEKAASAIKCGAELAEEWDLTMPPGLSLYDSDGELYMKLADELAMAPTLPAAWSLAFAPSVQAPLCELPDLQSHTEKLARSLRALADARVVLPLRDFLAVMVGDVKTAVETAAQVAPYVTGAYGDLLDGGEAAFTDNPFLPTKGLVGHAQRQWAEKLAATYGLGQEVARRRVAMAAIRGEQPSWNNVIRNPAMEKSAGAIRAMARQYALYKIAALAAMTALPDFDWLVAMAAVQDRTG